jgi:hypothetical protein
MKRANGTGSVSRLSGKRRKPFVATVTKGWELDGDKPRQLRVTLGYYESRRAAREALDAYLQAPIERPRITLKELYDEWSAVKYRNIGTKTVENYELAWKCMESLYGAVVKDLRTVHMQKIIDANEDKSSSYLQKIRILFNLLMKYALQHDIIVKNYAAFIVLPKRKRIERETAGTPSGRCSTGQGRQRQRRRKSSDMPTTPRPRISTRTRILLRSKTPWNCWSNPA